MNIQEYLNRYVNRIASLYNGDDATELTYRTDFQELLQNVFKDIKIEEIKQESKTGDENKPDFIIAKNKVPLLYIETKDIGVPLDKIEKSEQMSRYFGYANLVLTDYLEFRFYRNGLPYGEHISIGTYDKKSKRITAIPQEFEHLSRKLVEFPQSYKEPITSGKHLAKIMGGKAQRIRDNLKTFLSVESERNNEIVKVFESFKQLLVHDLDRDSFADMYAQTLVYGLFVARYYDDSPDTFTRQEARELIPKSNPFLGSFFDHIVGPNFDNRLEYIVDELCMVFSHSNVKELMGEYFKQGEGKDPVIHFYEDFLNEYDSVLRKRMGAYYTPQPVVNFIVRSVDYILKKDFNIQKGLVDSSKFDDGTHRVQILDPAVGTGTFISTVLNFIYSSIKNSNQPGIWKKYVHNDLLPRIHGFELMMAPYTIAHLKTSIAFEKTGFKYFSNRLGIYLTNSLEQTPIQGDMFNAFGLAESIAEESKQASIIKTKTPIMVVVGNPPYSGVSSNETESANNLVAKYKVEPGGKEKLQERKHWLNDDYVKFIALAEDYIEKNGSGVVGYITNHSYLDNPTFRGMRWHLLKTFDEIYVIDLHGNTKKKEISPDGSKDENIFDIQQGVAIFLGVKTNKKKENELGKVYRYDIWGSREKKYMELDSLQFKNIQFSEVTNLEPYYFFEKRNYEYLGKYNLGFCISDLFKINSMGITTAKDDFAVSFDRNLSENKAKDFYDLSISDSEIINRYNLKDNVLWKLKEARRRGNSYCSELIKIYSYRIFDNRFIYYGRDIVFNPRTEVMKHILDKSNIILNSTKRDRSDFSCYFVTQFITDKAISSSLDNSYVFPLYIYSEDGTKTPNLNTEIVSQIENIVGKTTPEDIFEYIYGVLHNPKYREKYKEFLKIDFPRIPYPKSKDMFNKYVKYGKQLKELHLLESEKINKYVTTYPIDGSDTIERIEYKEGKVYINNEQYFGNVPEISWNFYIGGYQPAQKWLKDRKGRELNSDDIQHYQQIIVVLKETDRIMKEIQNIE